MSTYETNKLYLLTGTLTSLEDQGRISVANFRECVVQEYSEDVLLEDSMAVGFEPSVTATVLSSVVNYLPLDKDEANTFLTQFDNGAWKIQPISHAPDVYKNLLGNWARFQDKLANGEGSVRRLSSQIGKDIQYLTDQLTRFKIIPAEMVRNDMLSNTIAIEEQWRELCRENRNRLTVEEGSLRKRSVEEKVELLQEADTEREGLVRVFAEHVEANGDEPLFVALKANIVSIEPSTMGLNSRVVLSDIEIRSYDPQTNWDNSEVIDKLDHLNSFVSDDTVEHLSEGTGCFLARVTPYQRSKSQENSIDISVRLVRFAPLEQWMEEWGQHLTNFESHLEVNGLVGVGSVHKKVREARKRATQPGLMPDTSQYTLNDLSPLVEALETRYQQVKEQQEQLIQEEQLEQAGKRRLHELSMEAISFLSAEK